MIRKEVCNKSTLKFLLFVLFGIIMVVLVVKYGPWITEKAKQPEKVREYVRSFYGFGWFIYVLIQAAHVLTVVIPGDVFNVCGGYIYGVPLGFTLSLFGIMMGSVMAFQISRFLGYDFVSKFIPEEKIKSIGNKINSTKGMLGMFILCIIPLIPKDLMMYIAGLTPVKATKLFSVYLLSRIPGTIIWVSVGANMYQKNIAGIVLSILGLLVLGTFCVVFKLSKDRRVDSHTL